MNSESIESMEKILKFQVTSFPFTYLGLSVCANMSLSKNWKPVLDKFQFRLSSWKSKAFSFGERITLFKAILGSLPIYHFSLFEAPEEMIDCLRKIKRKFLWGGFESAYKICWIAWDKVFEPMELGGLRVGSLRAANLELIAKWLWKLNDNTLDLWEKIVIHHGVRNYKLFPVKLEISGTWKQIVNINNDYLGFNIGISGLFKRSVDKR